MGSNISALCRNLIFIGGKGGVGKTTVSRALACAATLQKRKTLWITVEDPTRVPGEKKKDPLGFDTLNCEATTAFEEYIALKIKFPGVAHFFAKNKMIEYLAKAAPGIHELVILGKIWFERKHYDHVIIDLPSTGYGLALFQSTENFARLFKGGPIHNDAEEMLGTFSNPDESSFSIVSLPEEMPLQESLEMEGTLKTWFPKNDPFLILNRKFPKPTKLLESVKPDSSSWKKPVAENLEEFATKRYLLEEENLMLWQKKTYTSLYWKPDARECIELIAQDFIDLGLFK